MNVKVKKVIACILMLALISGECMALADVMILPESLWIIEEEAFYGDTSIDKVVLPEGVTEIQSRAFAESSLTEINLPASLYRIAEDAFDEPGTVKIIAEEGTYAHYWAIYRGYIREAIPVEEILTGMKSVSLKKGEQYGAASYVVILPYDADDKSLVWTSANASVASVDAQTGEITAVSYGRTQITATAADGSGVSAQINVEVLPSAPQIRDLKAVDSSSVRVEWDAVDGAEGYYVYYVLDNDEYEDIGYSYCTSESCTLTGLTPETSYQIWVEAVANGMSGEGSVSWFITTEKERVIPATPVVTNVSCESADDGICVSWQAAENAVGYNVYYSLSTSPNNASKISAGSSLSARITGVSAGKTYYVWVQAIGEDENSDFSASTLAVVPEEEVCILALEDDDDYWSPDYTADAAEFYVICDGEYSCSKPSTAKWLTVQQAGNTIYLSVEKNTTGDTRSAKVTVWCEEHDESLKIEVEQDPGVDFGKPTVTVDVEGDYCDIDWTPHSEATAYEYECAMGDTDNITYRHTSRKGSASPTSYDFLLSNRSTSFFFHVRYIGEYNKGPWSDWVYVVVGADNVPVTSITVKSPGTLYVGSSVTMRATVQPSDASCQDVSWSIVSGQSYASIDPATGSLTALKPGSIKVRATSTDGRNVYGERTMTIYEAEDATEPVRSLSITNGSFSMAVGSTKTLTAKILPSNATNKALNWVVRNGTGRAGISSSGKLTATAAGMVYVRVESMDGSGVESPEITVTITEHAHTWGEEYNENGQWYEECTSCGIVQAIVKYESGEFIEAAPQFIGTPTVTGGMYAGDQFTVTCNTTTNVSRIVVCYFNGTEVVEKNEQLSLSMMMTPSKATWTFPYPFEYTGESDTRTVILRCYDSQGRYAETVSQEFTCKERTAPTISLTASSPTSITNKQDMYVWVDAAISGADKLTVQLLNPDGDPILFRTAYHVHEQLQAVTIHEYDVNPTDAAFTGIGMQFPAGTPAGTYTVRMFAENAGRTSEPATLKVNVQANTANVFALTKNEVSSLVSGTVVDPWTGTGRYRGIIQGNYGGVLIKKATYCSTYWGDLIAGINETGMCNRAAASMALSYMGLDIKPKDFVGGSESVEGVDSFLTNYGVKTSKKTPTMDNFQSMYANFIRDAGKGNYSPVIIYTYYGTSKHWLVIIGQDPTDSDYYWVLDSGGGNYSQVKFAEVNGALVVDSYRYCGSGDWKTDARYGRTHSMIKLMQYQQQ